MENQSQEYQLSIKDDNGFIFEKKITDDECRRIVVLATTGLEATNSSDNRAEGTESTIHASETDKSHLTLNEFCHSYKFLNNYQRITAIAEYIATYENSNLQKDEIPDLFARAGFAPPKQLHRDVKETIKKGWISEKPKSENTYFVTGIGRSALKEIKE